MNKVAVVTGGSGGIGRAAAARLSSDGFRVYELSRRGVSGGGVIHITVDLCSEEQVKAAAERIFDEEGRIDLLINNAGYGISGPAETTDPETAKAMFDVDFFGVLRAVRAFAPYLKMTRGRIINISSVAAVMPIPFQSFYSCAKSAVNTLTMALANELRPFGVTVCALMPGDVRTGFTDNRIKLEGEGYGEAQRRAVAAMEKDERAGMTPEYIASRISKLANKKRVAPLYTAGRKYALFVFIKRLLPDSVVNFVLGKMYG